MAVVSKCISQQPEKLIDKEVKATRPVDGDCSTATSRTVDRFAPAVDEIGSSSREVKRSANAHFYP